MLCSTLLKGKSVVSERLIRTIKKNIYRHMTAVSKYICSDKLDNIIDKCINTYTEQLR